MIPTKLYPKMKFVLLILLVLAADIFCQNDDKLGNIREYVNSVLDDSKVPGLALGIIKDGEVVLAEGFGYRDIEKELPVTSNTLFAIGSCSKAFTTLAIGMLTEDGKVDWDKPVRDYLPEFKLKDSYITEHMTVRDLVTHRSGLPRHDAVWYARDLSRKELFDRLQYLDFSRGFREKYQYNNLMFMTAGYLVGQITQGTWEEYVQNNIFEPLNITGSNFSVEDSKKSDDFAKAYTIKDGVVKNIPLRNIDNVGPAGSINSSINDMLKWIQFHLDTGKVAGKQLVSKDVMLDMHTPYMHISSTMKSNDMSHNNYALGWIVSMYRGHKHVRHGGGIDGFITSTNFLPFDDVGVFVVNNAASGISHQIALYVIDVMLGLEPVDRYAEWKENRAKAAEKESQKTDDRIEGTTPSHPLTDYEGVYEHPAYGKVMITANEKDLSGSFNSFNFVLNHYHYDVFQSTDDAEFENTKITFHTNIKGEIDRLSSPIEPMVDPIIFTKIKTD